MFRPTLIVSLVLVSFRAGAADTAEDYFHRGAQHFVFGERQKAAIEVVTGLQQFPTDAQLQALAELLKKEQDKQQQQQQQDQQNQRDKQDEPKNQQQESQQQQNQNEKNQDQKNQQQDGADKKDQEKQQQSPGSDQKDQRSDEQPEPTPAAPGQMTPQQAKQLLDAQKGEDRVLPIRPGLRQPPQRGPIKDW